jgi:Pyruvate/2-oxoacid:ferredoxin oxidoreductase gamma subunit
MKDKNNRNQRIIELRRIELEKLSAIKRGLYTKGYWIPQERKDARLNAKIAEANRKAVEIARQNAKEDPLNQ